MHVVAGVTQVGPSIASFHQGLFYKPTLHVCVLDRISRLGRALGRRFPFDLCMRNTSTETTLQLMPGMSFNSRRPEDVIVSRDGSVLGKKTVLKSDHFPGCQNKKLLPHVEGAPNFRQVGDLPVYGVAIPTMEGIRRVLHLVGASNTEGGRRVIWHNMREEPVIYINGRPFVLREVERPFTNLEYTGIDRARVELMESRLKEDVLREAARYSNKVMVSDELPDGQMVDAWEPVGPDSVHTPLEVYQRLQQEGYLLEYERVPVTDEKSPKERDFDLLVERLSRVAPSTAQVFNCQMGRGRTTTGMVVATLIHQRRTLSSCFASDARQVSAPDSPARGAALLVSEEEALRRGEYVVVRSLLRVLERGKESKREVDAVIDKCSAMQNLREAILSYRNSIHKHADEKKRQAALSNFVEYLERYYFLICFAVYIHTDPYALGPRVAAGGNGASDEAVEAAVGQPRIMGAAAAAGGFQPWMRKRPELYSILRRLLRRDPMGALNYRTINVQQASSPSKEQKTAQLTAATSSGAAAAAVAVATAAAVMEASASDAAPASPDAAAAAGAGFKQFTEMSIAGVRNGAVLGRQTVLKSDHCPGCQNQNLEERVEGAPNFRRIAGFPVFGVANPTVAGIRAVLQAIGLKKETDAEEMREKDIRQRDGVEEMAVERVLWHNMREEAVVYINGKPFVLREAERPFKNMLEYTGINKERVEQMEARLKSDVLAEAARHSSAVMVTHETDDGSIVHVWEKVAADGSSVQTPLEVFQSLQTEGYAVDYERLPITDGKAPKSRDFDTLTQRIAAAGPTTAFVFNCQMGRGRTTTGTVIATLVIARCRFGTPLRLLPLSQNGTSDSGVLHRGGSSLLEQKLPEKISERNGGSEEEERGHLEHRQGRGDPVEGSLESPDGSIATRNLSQTRQESDASSHPQAEHASKPSKSGFPLGISVAVEDSSSGGGGVPPSKQLLRLKSTLESPSSPRAASSFDMDDISTVRRVTRLLASGSSSRAVLDSAIDRCDVMQNIRQAIVTYRKVFNDQDEDARARQNALSRGAEYLERYCMLIAFTEYLHAHFHPPSSWGAPENSEKSKDLEGQARADMARESEGEGLAVSAPDAGSTGQDKTKDAGSMDVDSMDERSGGSEKVNDEELVHLSFKQWLKKRPEIRQMKWSMRLRPARLFTISEVEPRPAVDSEEDGVLEAVVRSRSGSVLNHASILKLYVLPQAQRTLSGFLPHAPKFFKVAGFPLQSMAAPTIDGAREIITHILSSSAPPLSPPPSSPHPPLVITDLREEAVVYVCGQPYVLREFDNPRASLKHVGIEGPMVERMERRLKDDVLAEAQQRGGKILLHRESVSSRADENSLPGSNVSDSNSPEKKAESKAVEMEAFWQEVSSDDVMTPAELFAKLVAEGQNIDYRRVPLTRERHPKTGDIDEIQTRVAERLDSNPLFLFVSHTGHGASSYAMALSCLFLSSQRPGNQHDVPSTSSSLYPTSSPYSSSTPSPSLLPCSTTPSSSLPLPCNKRTSMDGDGNIAKNKKPSLSKAEPRQFAPIGPEEALRRGDYRDVLSLERVLQHGPASRAKVDDICERLLSVGDIRGDILEYKRRAEASSDSDMKTSMSDMALKALRRYCFLVAYAEYLLSTDKPTVTKFSSWFNERPELRHLLDHLKLT